MRFAQTVGRLDGFFPQLLISSLGYTPLSPVSWLVLAVPERLGWNVAFLATVLGALGWGITAVFWQKLFREWQMSVVDWLVPLLLVLSPVVVLTRGSFVSWFEALAWLAIWLTVRQKWWAQTVVLLLLLVVNVSITAVSLIIILLIWRIGINFSAEAQTRAGQRRSRRGENLRQSKTDNLRITSWLAVGLLVLASLLVLAGIGWQINRAPWQVSFPFADWLSWGRQWLYAGEFVWLFILFALVAVVGKRQTWPIAIWSLLALLDVNEVGQTVVITTLLFLAGVGIAVIGQWITQKQWFDRADEKVYLGAVGLLCLPLAWVLVSALLNNHENILAHQDAMQAGTWLRENSEVEAVVMADPAVGYAADRTVWSWNGRSEQQNWADFIRTVEPVSVDTIITDNTLFWDGLKHLPWWQDRFTLVQSAGSLDIWQSAPHPALTSEIKPLNVVLENGMRLVGYQQTPQSISPGETVYLSLHFQMEEPLKYGFGTLIALADPLAGESQSLSDILTPRAVPSNWWNPEQIVTEQFALTTDPETSVGGYRMTVSFNTREGYGTIPVYQNEDTNPLNLIQLDYVAVPGTDTVSESATPFNTKFGDEFKLSAADLPLAQASPGDELDVQLYWEAINPNRPQYDYTIFVHLLNEAGELAANADGLPQGGRYPTGAWVPGDVVVDGHRLLLPPDLASGNYEIRVGAYLLETGERLPAFDEAGNELPGANVLLMELVVE